jgi:tetratricopeptide (TPR) repeat protein
LGLFSFGKKKTEAADGSVPGAPAGAFVPQPDKAEKFFSHAKTAAQTGNHEYALMLYAKGLRFDPSSLARHEEFYRIAIAHYQAGGTPAGKEQIRELDGPGPVEKFVQAEYIWGRDPLNIDHCFRLLEAAGKAAQIEFGGWIAPRMLDLLRKQKKQTKAMWVKAKTLFTGVEAFAEALASIEEAVRADPTDTKLAADLKEITARHAIKAGGYDRALGGGGNFQAMVKDQDKQQELQDAASISASEDTLARGIERAKAELEANPMSAETVQKLGTLLRRLGTEESENEAAAMYMAAYERLSEYRFKMFAGEIRISHKRREVEAARKRVEADTDDEAALAAAKAAHAAVRGELLDLERTELKERQKNYPTDRSIKFELGRIEFELGNFEEAMGSFQSCKDEAKLRIASTHYLGKCFAAEGWHSEAIGEFREAITGLGAGEADRELPIKYDLMLSLMEIARAEQNSAYAREAGEICSAIVRRDISYRDIRQRRKEIDTLLKELPS